MKQIWFLRLISWSYNSTFSRNHCVHLASWLSSTFSGGNIQQLGQSPLFVPHSCIALLDPCPKDNIWPTESYFGSSDRCFAQATRMKGNLEDDQLLTRSLHNAMNTICHQPKSRHSSIPRVWHTTDHLKPRGSRGNGIDVQEESTSTTSSHYGLSRTRTRNLPLTWTCLPLSLGLLLIIENNQDVGDGIITIVLGSDMYGIHCSKLIQDTSSTSHPRRLAGSPAWERSLYNAHVGEETTIPNSTWILDKKTGFRKIIDVVVIVVDLVLINDCGCHWWGRLDRAIIMKKNILFPGYSSLLFNAPNQKVCCCAWSSKGYGKVLDKTTRKLPHRPKR